MSDPAPVRLATPHDRERVTSTYVAAFAADPAVRYFFPDDEVYPQQAAGFAGALFDQRVSYGTVWVVDDGAAVSMWNPPAALSDDVVFDLPDDIVARLADYESVVHTIMPTGPYWYLGVLATHPASAGQRWGRAVMAAGVDRARADELPAYLETSSPSNVELYERSGWTVVGRVVVDVGAGAGAGLPVWVLRSG